jgi:predicted ATPase
MVFDPKHLFDPNDFGDTYHLWEDFATKPKQGNCSLTLAYIRDIICSQNELANKWVLDLLSHMIQRPWEKPEVALLLKGPRGIGKSFLLDIVEMLVDGKSRHKHSFRTAS